MTDQSTPDVKLPDPVEMSQIMTRIAEQSHRLVSEFMERQAEGGNAGNMTIGDPLNIGGAFVELTARMMSNPAKLMEAQFSLWQDYLSLWQQTARRMMGGESEPLVKPALDDRRFKDAAWDDNYLFDFIKQSYLLLARWLQAQVREVEGLDEKTAKKVDFYTRQFVDAMAPSNFAMTNPEVIRATIESGGENLLRGLSHLLEDLDRGNGKLSITMTDLEAFEVGRNVATAPGKVVYENDLMQLIQYDPATPEVGKVPLIIIPPWINKYYILDLQPRNSLVRWATQQGLTVFIVSWVNPDSDLAMKSFDDYLRQGPLAALEAVEAATGEPQVHAVGYCLGGTLLAAALAYMAAHGLDRVRSATFFAALTDFAEAGELSVFIDEEQLAALEERMNEKGYLEGRDMATTFNLLRANDLIWSFVINNYLLGKEPFPFDLLYWNSDSTRMPAAMHSFYLRNMYQRNLLSKPGGITLLDTPIDLRRITVPTFMLSSREDHIAPWRSTYAATQIVQGPMDFVLAASGHIAGIVNPPAANKYSHWTNAKLPRDPEEWLAGAQQHHGSWWPRWREWLLTHDAEKVPARVPGDARLAVIEDAPGRYVRVRAEE